MSIVADIFETLWNTPLNYKGFRVNIFGVPKFRAYNHNSVKSTLSRLTKDNYIARDDRGWYITGKGKKYYKSSINFKRFTASFERNTPKNTLIMFDIPQERNSHRDWLRKQLREFDYIMVQRSVWVGPSPLPKEFLTYLKSIGIRDGVKIFKLAKGYNINR